MMQLTHTAKQVLSERYLLKDPKTNELIEDFDDLFERVGNSVANVDVEYVSDKEAVKITSKKFIHMMKNGIFLPNSPTLMNAGTPGGQLSACFVLPIDDSMDSIFDTLKTTALIHKSGGGTGFSFSRLRPKNSLVGSTQGVASGPVSFMRIYDAATEEIKQGGKRRGANMGILRIDHPDILEFIQSKQKPDVLTNFNISVGITKTFMIAYENDTNYELINPYTHEVTNYLNARKVFDLLVTCAWHTGDPGVIFIDSINEYNTVPDLGDIEATNPCGEQPLLPYEACNLGSLNLAKFIIPGTTDIDYTNLEKTVVSAVHFLDNVITLNNYPTEDITEETHKTRKIGLGIMGWADMLMKMGIRYGTRKSILLAEEIMQFITDKGIEASSKLAEIRGTFPSYELSIFYDKDNDDNCIPMRNATVTTIAPTGTLSIIANCSSGIEPVFNFVYTKTILDNQTFHIVHPVFSELLEQHNIELTNERKQEVAEKGSVQDCDWLNDELKHILVTAFDISPKDHLDMQAAFQKHTHNAVSKTINLPEDATEDDIRKIYLHSYYAGTKGVTVFRYGCKKGVLALKNKNKKDDKVEEHKTLRKPRKRPAITNGTTQRIATGCGNLYVTLNNDDIGFCEVFASMGKSGGCAASQLEACMRMASLALRVGIDPHVIVDQLSGIRCPTPTFGTGKMVYSCADGVSKIIGEMISVVDDNNPEDVETHKNHTHFIRPCPECGAGMESDGNCAVCRSCGYNLCG